ncbi:hypothetical protein LK994_12665 [Ferruginibacter lapsinanis]|uniref:hypothetical protein n=1 Tax=Ferruginibacter lapsinanis TaxID=563172 RepID=UPI001E4419CF|nr:hypothetical protein [Ferruginibacter lapsinanis]UEG49486.1 hypothetical protein LK994_12665 [Ferruginibacter lapsinanis]
MKSNLSFTAIIPDWLSSKSHINIERGLVKKLIDIIALITALIFCSAQFASAKNAGNTPPQSSVVLSGPSQLYKLYTSLYTVDDLGVATLSDGIVNTFYPTYNNAVDYQDAIKLNSFNTKESLSILRDGIQLAIESRTPVTIQDTINLEVLQMDYKKYQFQFTAQNWDPLLVPYLRDSYSGTLTPINVSTNNDITKFDFDVLPARPLMKEPTRFSIVFRPSGDLPVTYSSVKAYEQFNYVNLEWTVENEINIQQYSIERSTNGIDFSKVYTQPVIDNTASGKTYNWIDTKPEQGTSYYRICHLNKNGTIAYSKIIKVISGNKINSSLTVYPTVLTEGTTMVQMTNMPRGLYQLNILSNTGSLILTKSINHAGGNATQTISTDKKILPGLYQLSITGPGKFSQSFKLIGR